MKESMIKSITLRMHRVKLLIVKRRSIESLNRNNLKRIHLKKKELNKNLFSFMKLLGKLNQR